MDLQSGQLHSYSTFNGSPDQTLSSQMVIAAGLASLYDATGDESYLTLAQVSIDAAIYNLENHGILKESCDSTRGDTTCTSDEVSSRSRPDSEIRTRMDEY